MNKITFYDTETTGLPNWKIPSDDVSQPHLAQISAIQCDEDTQEILQRVDLIVRPDGWEIPEDVVKIHGITTEKALDVGIPEVDAIEMLLYLCDGAVRVAHNRTFDQRIIRIALKRYGDFGNITLEKWAGKLDHKCTMLMAKPIMEMLPKNNFGFKNPKLEEALEFFTGEKLGDKAHSSIFDTEGCMKIYFAMQDRKDD